MGGRGLILTVAALAAGLTTSYLVASGTLPLAPTSANAVVPSQKVAAPRPAAANPNRLYLAPQQQKEATQNGGFHQMPVSLLKVDRSLRYGDFLWDDQGIPPGPVTVRVDLRTQIMSVFRAGHEIGTAVVLYGADGKPTPLGAFPIMWKGKDHRSSLYNAPMPFTLRLTGDGVAVHGSDVRYGAATHGCVGVPTAFASRLFEQAKVGDVVTIVRTKSLA